MRPADLQLRLQIGEDEAAVLEIEDRLAERLALAGVFDRVVEGALRRGLRADRDRKPLLRQFAHQIDEALPLFAEAVGDRHADVVEEQLRRIGLVLPVLVEVAAALESFAAGSSAERRVGTELAMTCGCRWLPYQLYTNKASKA